MMDRSFMSLDRLTALFRHVQFRSVKEKGAVLPQLWAVQEATSIRVSFVKQPIMSVDHLSTGIGLDFGGKDSPLLQALPNELTMLLGKSHSAYPIGLLVIQETAQARCGSPVVLDRLFEVLLIMLLRNAIENGQSLPGLLTGLADDYIKHALVAVHENPGELWSTDRLAQLSHLSRTAFYQRFNRCVGVSPMHYVRGWRMSLANIRLQQGERIAQVATSLGYRSVEGFSRAFHQHCGIWPGGIAKQNLSVTGDN